MELWLPNQEKHYSLLFESTVKQDPSVNGDDPKIYAGDNEFRNRQPKDGVSCTCRMQFSVVVILRWPGVDRHLKRRRDFPPSSRLKHSGCTTSIPADCRNGMREGKLR